MALVIQNVVGVSSYQPYERPPDPVALWSAIPRGLQTFFFTTALDAITVGNNALLNLNSTLPVNFGYVMADAAVTLSMVGAGNDWNRTFILTMNNFYRGPPSEAIPLVARWLQELDASDHIGDAKSMKQLYPWPTYPMVAPDVTGISAVMSMFNNATTARAAGVLFGYISFWVFDLEQIRKYAINSPIPTHSR